MSDCSCGGGCGGSCGSGSGWSPPGEFGDSSPAAPGPASPGGRWRRGSPRGAARPVTRSMVAVHARDRAGTVPTVEAAASCDEPRISLPPRTSARRRASWKNLARGPLDRRPPADPRYDTGYWKTRVERILEKAITVPAGASIVRRWLTSEQMQRDSLADAKDGLFFVRVDAAGELSCEARVYWEVPGAVMEYELTTSRTSLTFGAVERIVGWAGPTPGLICLELRFDNLGPATTATVLADVSAKRVGANFMPGHFLRDRTGALRVPHGARAFDPDPEGLRGPRKRPRKRKCLRVVMPVSASPMPRSRVATIALTSGRRARERSRSGSGAAPAPPGSRYEPVCPPAASAIDWRVGGGADGSWSYVDKDGTIVWVVPDPEVMAAWRQFGENFILTEPRSGVAVLFPLRFDIFDSGDAERLDSWYRWIARCVGFDQVWEEVSQGFEHRRLPQYKLSQMLLDDLSNAYTTDSEGVTVRVADFVNDALDTSRTDWNWAVPAPWLSNPQEWGLMSLVNVINGSLDLLPTAIRSPRTGTTTIVLDSARLVERFTRAGDTNLRLAVVDFDRFFDARGPFSVADGTWAHSATWIAELDAGIEYRGQTNGLAARDPIPASIALNAALTVPYFDAASQCYAMARLLSMIAAKYKGRLLQRTWDLGNEPVGDAYTVLVDYAKVWYRMHLGALMHPGKTLVHEMFHTTIWHGPDQWSLLEYEDQIADTNHCGSGCGQEKMSSTWLMRVCGEHGAWYPDWDGDEPFRLLATQVRSSSSTCVSAGEASSFEGGDVSLDWTIDGLGTPEATLTWSFDADLSADTQATVTRLQNDWSNAAAALNARLAAIKSELGTLESARESDFWRYLELLGPIVEPALLLEQGWDLAAVGVVNAWYAGLIGDLQRGQRDRFEQMCWTPTSTSQKCGRFGSCG